MQPEESECSDWIYWFHFFSVHSDVYEKMNNITVFSSLICLSVTCLSFFFWCSGTKIFLFFLLDVPEDGGRWQIHLSTPALKYLFPPVSLARLSSWRRKTVVTKHSVSQFNTQKLTWFEFEELMKSRGDDRNLLSLNQCWVTDEEHVIFIWKHVAAVYTETFSKGQIAIR